MTGAPEDSSHGDSAGNGDLVSQLARGTGVGFVGRVGGKALGLVLEALLTRVLGPTVYGLYVLGRSVMSIGRLFATLGLKQGAVRFGSIQYENDDERLTETIAISLTVSLLSGLVVATAVFLLADRIARTVFGDPSLAPALELFALSLPFYVLLDVIASYLQALKRIDVQQFLQNVLRPIGNLLFIGTAFVLGFRLAGAIGGFLLTGVVSVAVGLYLLSRQGVGLVPSGASVSRETAVELLTFSVPMMFVSMSYQVSTHADRLMLGMFRDAQSVGIYNVAAIIALQFAIVHMSLLAIVKPLIADTFSNDDDTARLSFLYNTVKKWSTYGTLVLFVITALYAQTILSVFGSAYTESYVILYVLPLRYVGGSLFGPTGSLLAMTGREKIELLNGLALVSLNIVLNLVLIPPFGPLGAAIAVVSATVVVNAAETVFIRRIYGFHPFDTEHIVLMTVTMGVVITSVWIGTTGSLVERTIACLLTLTGCTVLFYRQINPSERGLFGRAIDSL
jgi:O-antigen/teichoic acid export membrane protein